MKTATLALLALGLAASACRNEEKKLAESRDKVRSWAATIRFASSKWNDGELPDPYVRVLGNAAEKAVDGEQRKLQKNSSPGSAEAAAESRSVITEIGMLQKQSGKGKRGSP